MDKKTFAIGILCVTMLILFVANMLVPPPAMGQVAVKDRDYQAVTARMARGGDALYLTDNRTGKIAVFVYNPQRKVIELIDGQILADAFPAAPAGR